MTTETYESEIDIAAPRDLVWVALTESRRLEEWFCEHAEVSLVDGRYDFWGRFTPGNPPRDAGSHKILELDAPNRLVYAFNYLGGETTVQLTLDGDTRVHVLHTEVPERPDLGGHHPRHLWANALTQLRGYLEQGRPGPRFDWSWAHMGAFFVQAEIAAPRADVYRHLVDGWTTADVPNRKPPRSADEDFVWDVGFDVGIKVLDVTEPETFKLAWNEPRPTVLTYTLAESGSRTIITLVHSGFADDEDIQGMAEGFFSGIYEMAWKLETKGAWPPPAVRIAGDQGISGGVFGVRTIQGGRP